VAFTDGHCVGALLDRNGLRPARYTVTKDGFMVLASETGVLDFAPEISMRKAPCVRAKSSSWIQAKRVLKNSEIKTFYARRRP